MGRKQSSLLGTWLEATTQAVEIEVNSPNEAETRQRDESCKPDHLFLCNLLVFISLCYPKFLVPKNLFKSYSLAIATLCFGRRRRGELSPLLVLRISEEECLMGDNNILRNP